MPTSRGKMVWGKAGGMGKSPRQTYRDVWNIDLVVGRESKRGQEGDEGV